MTDAEWEAAIHMRVGIRRIIYDFQFSSDASGIKSRAHWFRFYMKLSPIREQYRPTIAQEISYARSLGISFREAMRLASKRNCWTNTGNRGREA